MPTYDPSAIPALFEREIDAVITLDVESFYDSDYGFECLTTEQYVRGPRWETILVGVKVDQAAAVWMHPEDFVAWAARVRWDRVAVVIHNAHFDALVLSHHYGIRPAVIFCTLSMARALHGTEVGNSLARLATYYAVGEKGHEVILAKGKHRRDFTPSELAAYGGYCVNDCELTRRIFDRMLEDGFPENELLVIDTTVRMFTEPQLVLNEPLLVEYLAWEKERKHALLVRIAGGDDPEKFRKILGSGDKLASLFLELGVDEVPTKLSPTAKNEDGTPKTTFAFAKTDPGMQDLLEHENDEIRWVAEARIAIKSTINESRTARFLASGAGGRPVPVYQKYAAAKTFRAGGGDKMNFQNLERVPEKPKPGQERKGSLRKSLLAPEGKTTAVADSGQIEARVNAWVSGEEYLLDVFRRNDALGEDADFYSDAGSPYFGRKLSKKETPTERQVAKGMLLGLGFQMGEDRFAGELLKGIMGADPIQFGSGHVEKFGVDVADWERGRRRQKERWTKFEATPSRISLADRIVHTAVAAHFVRMYRSTNQKIAGFWALCEEVLEVMEPDGDGASEDKVRATFGPGECLSVVRHGIILPNGLMMRYPGLRKSGSGYSYNGDKYRGERAHIYGGKLTENIVQALARIIVFEQKLIIRAALEAKYGRTQTPIAMSTHDEVAAIVPMQDGEETVEYMKNIMRMPPVWASSLPLNASGDHARSYGEAK